MVGGRLDAPQEDERSCCCCWRPDRPKRVAGRGGGRERLGLRFMLAAHAVFPLPPIAAKSLCPLPAGKSSNPNCLLLCARLADPSRFYLTLCVSTGWVVTCVVRTWHLLLGDFTNYTLRVVIIWLLRGMRCWKRRKGRGFGTVKRKGSSLPIAVD